MTIETQRLRVRKTSNLQIDLFILEKTYHLESCESVGHGYISQVPSSPRFSGLASTAANQNGQLRLRQPTTAYEGLLERQPPRTNDTTMTSPVLLRPEKRESRSDEERDGQRNREKICDLCF